MAESYALIILEFLIMFMVVGYLLRSYKAPAVGKDVVVSTYLAWVLGFAGILLLPYDISVALVEDKMMNSLRLWWDMTYWSTFLLAWIILPVQLAYHMSGHFKMSGKLYDALLSNAISYALSFVFFVIFVIYMLTTNGGSTSALVGFMMAMANTYGLMIVIVLMGNGLVALPRRLWEMGSTSDELVRLYMLASSVDTAFHDARFDLEDCELDAKRLKPLVDAPGVDIELKAFFCVIEEHIAKFDFKGKSMSRQYSDQSGRQKNPKEDENLKKSLVNLNGKLLSAQRRIVSSSSRWINLLETVQYLEVLAVFPFPCYCSLFTGLIFVFLKAVTAGTLKAEDSSWCGARLRSQDSDLMPSAKGCCSPLFAIICAGASALILWSEMTMAISTMESPIGMLLGQLSSGGAGIFVTQFVAFLALAYMSVCTYWAMFRMNLGWAFTLQPNQQSPSTSLLFNATYLCRLQFSLAFNFLLILDKSRMSTSFQTLLVNMEVVPLFGAEFNVYAPIIILIMGFLTIFNVYARILKLIGIDSEDAITGGCSLCHKLDADDIELIAIGKKHVGSQLRLISTVDNSNSFGRGSAVKTNFGSKDTSSLLATSMENGHGEDNFECSGVHLEAVENPLFTAGQKKAIPTGRLAPEKNNIFPKNNQKHPSDGWEAGIELRGSSSNHMSNSHRRQNGTERDVSIWGDSSGAWDSANANNSFSEWGASPPDHSIKSSASKVSRSDGATARYSRVEKESPMPSSATQTRSQAADGRMTFHPEATTEGATTVFQPPPPDKSVVAGTIKAYGGRYNR